MIPLLHSGRFWLKLMVYGAIGLFVLAAAGIVFLHYLFDSARIQQMANKTMAGTGRHIRFDADISRTWFPRPTVTLYHVRIDNPAHTQTDIDMEKMRIGLTWSSVFGQRHIEKWQWKNAHIRLYRTPDGRWNLCDLAEHWQRQPVHALVNRIVIDQGTVDWHDDQGHVNRFSQIQAHIRRLNRANSPFAASGQWQRGSLPPVLWQLKATLHDTPRQWRDAELSLAADLPHLGPTTATWQFQGSWHTQPLRLTMRDVQWQSQSSRDRLQINGTGKNWQISTAQTNLPQLNAVITAQRGDNVINATLSINRLFMQAARWQIDRFQLDSGWQNQHTQSALVIGGSLRQSSNQQWSVDHLTISSHQDSVNQLPNPRWLGEISGQITGRGSQAVDVALQGTFDNQPVQLSAQYRNTPQQAEINGELNLSQLNLTPYLPDGGRTEIQPAWLTCWGSWLRQRHLQWQINIGRVLSKIGQITDFSSHIDATDQRIVINPFQATLYGGSSSGQFSIDNTRPVKWRMQQNLTGIQIKPLLQDSVAVHNLDGQGDARFSLSGEGMNNRDWLARLNGSVHFGLRRGVLRGIDINNILQTRQNLSTTLAFSEGSQTPFQNLQLFIPISNGHSSHSRLSLMANNFAVSGEGQLNLLQRSMNYDVMINTRQAGERSKLPLRVNGHFSHPAFSLDYGRLTNGLQTAKQKQQALSQTLRQQWQWLNQGSQPNPLPDSLKKRETWSPARR